MRISDWSSDVCSSDLKRPWDSLSFWFVAQSLRQARPMRKDNRSAARATVNQERRSQGAGIAVGAGAVEAGAASGAVKDSISPASAADIRFDRLPASSALRPSFAARKSGV